MKEVKYRPLLAIRVHTFEGVRTRIKMLNPNSGLLPLLPTYGDSLASRSQLVIRHAKLDTFRQQCRKRWCLVHTALCERVTLY